MKMGTVQRRAARAAVTCCVLMTLVAAVPALAQQTTAPAPPPPTDETASDAFASGPKPGTTSVNVTAGFQLQKGQTETLGTSFDGVIAHMSKQQQLLRFAASQSHAEYRPAPGADRLTVENNATATGDYIQALSRHVGAMLGAEYRRDTIIGLDYRVYGRGGIAFLADHPRASFLVGVGAAAGRQHSLVPGATHQYTGVGFNQSLTVHPTPRLLLKDAFSAIVGVGGSTDRTVNFQTSATAQFAAHAGLSIAYTYTYDKIHPVIVSATQQELTVGVQLTFEGK
jgi:hypothetical protein